jgi:toll-like receptor 2
MTKSRYHGYKSVKAKNQSDNFKYDAFVSYADEDMPFVQKLVSQLEAEGDLSLCIHHRDFVPGYNIAENIITAVNRSRKTIVVLSPNFVKSEWCKYELHIAKMEEIYSRDDEAVLFLILYEAVAAKEIPLCIMDLIQQKSYIEFPNDDYGDCVFWNRVCETLQSNVY